MIGGWNNRGVVIIVRVVIIVGLQLGIFLIGHVQRGGGAKQRRLKHILKTPLNPREIVQNQF